MAIDEAETLAADLASVPESLPGSSDAHRLIARGDTVGRYVMITRLGAGTMGEVWAAYDPELDRKLAVKLLHPQRRDGAEGRRHHRMLREAQALAKLSHPNVVAIHDVGTMDGMVWLAMEFVEGETLRAWSKAATRSWQEVLDVMLAAGRGLVAAHAAGLVHRDVKPENIMVGSGPDGSPRVRVMDFGLVRAELDRVSSSDVEPELASTSGARPLALELTMSGGVVGTPAYMAPEQQIDPRTDARGDQFGFCVTMWECLFGQRPFRGDSLPALASAIARGEITQPPADRPTPAWLRRVCERGFAARPDQRWSSMAELLDALARGRTRGRSRRITLAVGGLALVGAVALGWYAVAERNAARECDRLAAAIDDVWPSARADVERSLAAVGSRAGEVAAERAPPLLDAWAEDWRSARRTSCRAYFVDHAWDDALRERADHCFADRASTFAAFVAQLAAADAGVAERAVAGAAGLESAEYCADEIELRRRAPPPDPDDPRVAELRELSARAAAATRAGRFVVAHEAAEQALAIAVRLDDPALLAATRMQVANALDNLGRWAESEQLLLAAFREGRDDDGAARSAALLTLIVGTRLGRAPEGLVWATVAEVATARLEPARDGLRTADQQYMLASVYLEIPDLERARTATERTLAIREALLGPDNPATINTLNLLGIVLYQAGDVRGALAIFQRVLALREALLGPEHDSVGRAAMAVANAYFGLGEYDAAVTWHRRALAIFEQSLPAGHPELGTEQINLATVLTAAGALDEARAAAEPGVAILETKLGNDHPDTAHAWFVLAQVYRAQNEVALAEPLYRRALAVQERVLGPEHPDVAHTLLGLGSVAVASARYDESVAAVARARAIFVTTLGEQHREVAQADEALAEIALARGDREEATSRFRAALANLAAADASAAVRVRIQKRLDELEPPRNPG